MIELVRQISDGLIEVRMPVAGENVFLILTKNEDCDCWGGTIGDPAMDFSIPLKAIELPHSAPTQLYAVGDRLYCDAEIAGKSPYMTEEEFGRSIEGLGPTTKPGDPLTFTTFPFEQHPVNEWRTITCDACGGDGYFDDSGAPCPGCKGEGEIVTQVFPAEDDDAENN